MKKIGLVTCYIDNYGACLQAYALQTIIKHKGFDCNIIRYDYMEKISDSFSLPSFWTQLKRNIKLLSKFRIKRIFLNKHLLAREKQFVLFRQNELSFSKKCKTYSDLIMISDLYDGFVCGSDQIWNPTLGFARDINCDTLQFTNKPKIAYAPSIGVDYIPDCFKAIMQNNISNINFVSCRENVGTNLILDNHLCPKCETVLDPTLLLSKDDWLSYCTKAYKKKKYIFCYFFSDNLLYDKAIAHFQKKYGGIDVYIIPFTKKQHESKYTKLYDVTPFDFVSLIANAELVLTDSFHGTAFSINLNTNFYVLYRFGHKDPSSMNSRIDSILSVFNLRNRLIFEDSNLDLLSNNEGINFEIVNTILDDNRKKSNAFLDEALSHV